MCVSIAYTEANTPLSMLCVLQLLHSKSLSATDNVVKEGTKQQGITTGLLL